MEVTLIKNFSNFNEISCCDFLFVFNKVTLVFNNQKFRRLMNSYRYSLEMYVEIGYRKGRP